MAGYFIAFTIKSETKTITLLTVEATLNKCIRNAKKRAADKFYTMDLSKEIKPEIENLFDEVVQDINITYPELREIVLSIGKRILSIYNKEKR